MKKLEIKLKVDEKEIKFLRDLWNFDECPPFKQCPAEREKALAAKMRMPADVSGIR